MGGVAPMSTPGGAGYYPWLDDLGKIAPRDLSLVPPRATRTAWAGGRLYKMGFHFTRVDGGPQTVRAVARLSPR
jgi:hypothetical protein